ncbi:group 1 glycosyl transferase,Capsular glucan synthase,lipopolysaccharide 1,2-N-acetylglucosaminetransferase,Glycogen synthase,glycogen synthase, Corynebacterium family,Glycosyl transferases group 1 [[Clostridium] sordellii]|uniref:glycosyltransferase family 4 protein n=1 Tax=Paraclostridium sordellii TaxID=1505 RepID=UPI000542C28D|nr:glycosyltransferase family 1 protein [Paeniclostridium sordellii]CEK35534.1 group 1 glycosyl transferase,Capsular glucan synthase,lipopolysaccharide 1,2-N-acetylglucosaminetransferase,Glycogen synthase,glycogen synthase, Corynebacterium family,Glycosyl transferases group 1 [[Clostridium] sordellii] [Paeniclostridium sordellii]
MKIIINALQYDKNGAGISKYAHKLAEYMNKNVDILVQNDVKLNFNENNIKVVDKTINGSKDRILEEQLNNLKLFRKYDLVHFPDYATPILYKGKKVATIHDMAMHTMEDKYTKSQVFVKKFFMKNTIKNADKLICISNFTAKELKKYYPYVDENKIEVVYNGFEYKTIHISEKESREVLNKFNIDKKYLLYVGTISPHKNIDRLIEAFYKVRTEGYDYKLVIAGKKGWMYEDILNKSKKLGIERYVIFTDYVTDEELEVLYTNANVFTFPSLYEGFGFPPIEAMARKVPVVSSKEGALGEVVDDAALICDAYDIDDIASKIINVITDKKLRSELIEKGIKRSSYFSWEKTANQTYEIYKKVLRGE